MSNPFETLELKLDRIEELILNLQDGKSKPQAKKYLTRIDVAERLHVTLPTLDSYTRQGYINGNRIGNRVLYTEQDVEAAVTSMRRK